MLEFTDLKISDRDLFRKYLGDYPFKTYEYSFTTLYLWREFCKIQHVVYKDALIIRKTERKSERRGCSCFMPPVGYRPEELREIVDELHRMSKCNKMGCLFRDVEAPFLDTLRKIYGSRVVAREDKGNFDYIYESKKLATLSGRKLHAKKNHYNKFVKTYEHEVKDILEPGVIADCIDFSQAWHDARGDSSEQLVAEIKGIRDVLNHAEFLGIKGIAVYVDGHIAGFTLGEQVSKEMAVIHVEKADAACKGIYAFINRVFVDRYFRNVKYINREEDLGIEGLRRAKASYYPVRLEKKCIVDLS